MGTAPSTPAFTYVLPGLGIAHASPDEVMPFVGAFGVLSLVLTALSAKVAAQSRAAGARS